MTVEPPPLTPDEILALLETYPAGESRTAQLNRYPGGPEGVALRLSEAADEAVHQDAPRARRLAQAALELAEPLERPAVTARVLRSLVQALATLGQFEAALPFSLRAYQLYQAGGAPVEATRTLLGRTHVLAALGRYDEALAAADQARAAFQQAGEDVLAGVAAMNLGNVHQRLDHYETAETFYRQAQDIFVRNAEASWQAQADFNLGNALMHLNRPVEASAAFQRAQTFFASHHQTVAVAMLQANLGFLELRQCHYPLALQHYQHARDTFNSLGMERDIVQMDMEIASVYLDVNLLREASAAFQQAAETFQRIGQNYEAGFAFAQLALAHTRLGHFASAEQALAQARQLFEQEANSLWLSTCDLYTALLHLAQGSWVTAYAAARQAAAGLVEPGQETRQALAYLAATRASLALGWHVEANAHLDAAAQRLAEFDLPPLTYHLEHWRGRLHLAQGEVTAAQTALEAAVRAAERVRQTLPGDLLRSAYREDKLGAYQALAAVLLSEQAGVQTERAFTIVEQAKALALAERVGQVLPLTHHDLAQAAESERLRAQLNWYYSAYTDWHPETSTGDWATLRQAIHSTEQALVEGLLRRDLHSPTLEGLDPSRVSLREVQTRLGADQALLEYFVADGEILALLVRDTHVEVHRNLARAPELSEQIEQLRAHFARYALGQQTTHPHSQQLQRTTKAHLGRLYQSLIGSMATTLPERLIIVPHDVLHYVPFQALFDGEHFLIEHHQVTYAPSATLWAYGQAQPAQEVSSALAMAVTEDDLPHVGREADILKNLFLNVRVCVGAEATRANFWQYAPQADLLHIATHAVFREDNALFSALRLTDEWVTVHDLSELRLRPALVVLTGCETGLSRVAPGDELLGLTRAFLTAGAATLVVSLWPVHDESAAEWMDKFYPQVRAGLSPAAAAREAQLALMQARPDPYYWAAFIVVGRS